MGMFAWLANWLDRRRRARTWVVVRKWERRCIWRDSGETAGRSIIIGHENGLGERRVEMLKSPLPPEYWGDPKQIGPDWAEALNWKYEIRAPVNGSTKLRVIK